MLCTENRICGVGVNDKQYPTKINYKKVKEYALWEGMLYRCYSKDAELRQPAYEGVVCSENFKSYSFFYEWCQEQIGFGNIDENGRPWQLDKDLLLKGNKVYSEDTCVFIPSEVNLFFTSNAKKRGEYYVGVHLEKSCNKFSASCRKYGDKVYLGCYKTQEEAFQAYKEVKEGYCKELASKWKDSLDQRAYKALMKWEVSGAA